MYGNNLQQTSSLSSAIAVFASQYKTNLCQPIRRYAFILSRVLAAVKSGWSPVR